MDRDFKEDINRVNHHWCLLKQHKHINCGCSKIEAALCKAINGPSNLSLSSTASNKHGAIGAQALTGQQKTHKLTLLLFTFFHFNKIAKIKTVARYHQTKQCSLEGIIQEYTTIKWLNWYCYTGKVTVAYSICLYIFLLHAITVKWWYYNNLGLCWGIKKIIMLDYCWIEIYTIIILVELINIRAGKR